MKWIGISGTWRTSDALIERDVRNNVQEIMLRGDGIVTGGAAGVDYFATDEALKWDPEAKRIKTIIPATFASYVTHLREWAQGNGTGDPAIEKDVVERLITQLINVKACCAIIEGPNIEPAQINQKAYYERNSVVAAYADELLAFQLNHSAGTQDTIDKARAAGKPVTVHQYSSKQDLPYNKPLRTETSDKLLGRRTI